MDEQKRRRLEAAGWTVGSVEDFLGLSPDELAYIDMSLALSRLLKERREQARISHQALARKLKSSPSLVAKMEAGDSSATVDMLMRALLALGVSPADIGQAIAAKPEPESLRRAS